VDKIPFTEEQVRGFFSSKINKIQQVIENYDREIARANVQRTPEFVENKKQLVAQLEMYVENISRISDGTAVSHFKKKSPSKSKSS